MTRFVGVWAGCKGLGGACAGGCEAGAAGGAGMGRRMGGASCGIFGNGAGVDGVFGNGVADGCGTSARCCAESGCGLPVRAYVNAAARRAMSGSVYAANRAEAHVPSVLRRPPTRS